MAASVEEDIPSKSLRNLPLAGLQGVTATVSEAALVVVEASVEASAVIEEATAEEVVLVTKEEVGMVAAAGIRADRLLQTHLAAPVEEAAQVGDTTIGETDTAGEEQQEATMTPSAVVIEDMKTGTATEIETGIETKTVTDTEVEDAMTTTAPENDTTKTTGMMILGNAEGIEHPPFHHLRYVCNTFRRSGQVGWVGGYPVHCTKPSPKCVACL